MVEQSFALVQVGDVPGVRTYLENQPMGSTDGSGKILVPSLGAFRANRISIADGDVPIDRTILSRELLVAKGAGPCLRPGEVPDRSGHAREQS